MIIVSLIGGLGNQMFQYSMGRSLAKYLGRDMKLDVSFYKLRNQAEGFFPREYALDIFNLKEEILDIDRDLSPEDRVTIIREEEYTFNGDLPASLVSINGPILIAGYWQSPRYFENVENELRNDFTFRDNLPAKWLEILDLIAANNSVMLNVRRSDYLTKPGFHGVVSISYISEAMKLMNKLIKEPFYFIFSDDMDWCKENISPYGPHFFVGEEFYDKKFGYYLQLMKSCRHFILSNSSFCWWAAWLSDNGKKIIIAPEKWFTTPIDTSDLIPANWIRL